MKWGWIGIAAVLGALWGYRRKVVKALPAVVDVIRSYLDPEDLMAIYEAVGDKESRHETAVQLLVEAANRKGIGFYVTPGAAEQFIDNIDEIIRRLQQCA